MRRYALGTDSGPVRQFVIAADRDQAMEQARAGEIAIAYDGDEAPTGGVIADGAISFPGPSLAEARAARRREANAYRDARQAGGCDTPLGRVDTDPTSREKIAGAASSAGISLALGMAYPSITWTMADQSQVSHSAQQLVALGMAVVAMVNVCQQACTAIKMQIDAAGTIEAVAAIDITGGYPA